MGSFLTISTVIDCQEHVFLSFSSLHSIAHYLSNPMPILSNWHIEAVDSSKIVFIISVLIKYLYLGTREWYRPKLSDWSNSTMNLVCYLYCCVLYSLFFHFLRWCAVASSTSSTKVAILRPTGGASFSVRATTPQRWRHTAALCVSLGRCSI